MALYPTANALPTNIDPTPSANTAIATVTVGVAAVSLLAANANRKGMTIYNNSVRTLYLGVANTVTVTTGFFAIVPANTLYEWSVETSYVGALFAIANGAGASVQVMELTP
jgi:hypothetical protein